MRDPEPDEMTALYSIDSELECITEQLIRIADALERLAPMVVDTEDEG